MDANPENHTILLVDDDQFITVVYREGLEKAGYNVMTVHDGEAALESLRANLPNLVLLDIIMPKLNGFEVLEAVQNDETLKTIPFIVLTNLSQASDEQEARRLGAVDFITKSDVSFNELLLRIQQHLQH